MILAAVRGSDFGVTIADATLPDLPLVYANKAFERLTGYSFDEIVGRNCRFLQGPETSKKAVDRLREAIQNEQPITTLLLNYRKDRSKFWNRLQLTPIHDSDGALRAYMSVQIDITKDVSYTTVDHERQKVETLGRLAGGVAHELNNALQPIILMAETLRDEMPEAGDDLRPCVDSILEHAHFAKEVVAGVLTFARREQTKTDAFDLQEIVAEVIAFASEFLPSGVRVEEPNVGAGLKSIEAAVINVNRAAFAQLFTNMFKNASDAMQGDGRIDVALDVRDLEGEAAALCDLEPGRYAVIDVSDSGPGIPPENLIRVFDPFFTTKRPGEGTGLGLSTAYGIARGWAGTITAASNGGAHFTIYIPLAPPGGPSASLESE